MRSIKNVSSILLAIILFSSIHPLYAPSMPIENISQVSSRSTGVDLSVSDVSFSYTSTSDQLKYQMFSSNHPITGFDRPADLFVVDAVIDIPINIEFTVANLGTSSSGNFNVIISILHNEYTDFELHNETISISSLNGGSSSSGQKTIIPTYSGNHTLHIFPILSVIDDNPTNDMLSGSFTVAYQYFNCNDLSSWSVGNQWNSNSDTSLSQGSACHIGNGQSSTYSSNLNTSLITPAMDMSDALSNPTRTNGLTFFYTGSILSGDVMKIYMNDNMGIWNEMASVSGTIDQIFTDGSSWQTWSVNHGGAYSPLIPVQQHNFNSQTQFKFEFTSDAMNNDIGLWMDDIVIVYDQKVKQSEYGLTTVGISSNGAVPGSWGKITIELTNTGNITETFTPSMIGVPTNWNTYYSNPSGVSINPTYGILLSPGESRQIDINFQPDSSAAQGLYQATFKGFSTQYNAVESQMDLQFQVIPDRIPKIYPPSSIPACQPGNTCTFSIEVENIGEATDVFDITIDSDNLPIGWSVALAWSQSSSILVQPGTPSDILMTFTVPSTAIPDSIGKFELKMTSQNDTSRVDVEEIELSASMVSDAEVEMNFESMNSDWIIQPGQTKTIFYTILNNATSQDIYTAYAIIRDQGQWIVEQPTQSSIVINSGKSTVFSISITAPEQAQMGDICPKITPQIVSSRSGTTFLGMEFGDIEISRQDDLLIRLIQQPESYNPGADNMVIIEIENNGNGPNNANLEIENLPNDWSWKMMIDEEEVFNPISLSAIYDLEDVKQIELLLVPPSTTLAGNLYQFDISISSADGTEDRNSSDNIISLQGVISLKRNIILTSNISQIYSGVGNDTTISATIQNLGNAHENNVMIRAQINTMDNDLGITSYFTIGQNGILFDLDKYHTLNLNIGDLHELVVGFEIPQNFEIGSIIVVRFDVQSMNESGPIFQSVETMVNVDYRRSMSIEFNSNSNVIVKEGNSGLIWVNLTSTSTVTEQYTINAELPEKWQAICAGIILNSSGYTFENTPGHIIAEFSSTSCEIFPLDGEESGDVVIYINNQDGSLQWQETIVFTFERSTSDGFEFTSNMIAGSIAGILGLIILTLLILRRRHRPHKEEDMVEEEKTEPKQSASGPPISGPPIQSFNQPQGIAEQNTMVPQNNAQIPIQMTSQMAQEVLTTSVPPLPTTGLPPGWTHEQWTYYGQRYLDNMNLGEK